MNLIWLFLTDFFWHATRYVCRFTRTDERESSLHSSWSMCKTITSRMSYNSLRWCREHNMRTTTPSREYHLKMAVWKIFSCKGTVIFSARYQLWAFFSQPLIFQKIIQTPYFFSHPLKRDNQFTLYGVTFYRSRYLRVLVFTTLYGNIVGKSGNRTRIPSTCVGKPIWI